MDIWKIYNIAERFHNKQDKDINDLCNFAKKLYEMLGFDIVIIRDIIAILENAIELELYKSKQLKRLYKKNKYDIKEYKNEIRQLKHEIKKLNDVIQSLNQHIIDITQPRWIAPVVYYNAVIRKIIS